MYIIHLSSRDICVPGISPIAKPFRSTSKIWADVTIWADVRPEGLHQPIFNIRLKCFSERSHLKFCSLEPPLELLYSYQKICILQLPVTCSNQKNLPSEVLMQIHLFIQMNNQVYIKISLFGKQNIRRSMLRERQVERSGPEAAMQSQTADIVCYGK